ncbi:AMP-binding protein [Methylobacterium organophilum]|uniref:AMP-binding protein n=1 Tax=Methylobacterium organophilum TaxID=410 RepID=UPI001F1309A4|nr:AMP-binding protein [Methylobacterium organophilum]UMY16862.1 AMP-binding protein [Methylobacterium organophilum]
MTAHRPIGDEAGLAAQTPSPGLAPLARIRLGLLLSATARRHPDRVAFVDPADKAAWSDRPAITWTYAAAAEIVERFARGLRAWRLPPGSRIGLCLPPGSEGALAFLAVEAAGHLPCLLPVSWDEEKLLAAAQSAGLCAILTQSRLGSLALAQRLCGVAARYFGLRYLAAFGPEVPDGVINLDAMALDGRNLPARTEDAPPPPLPCGGLVSFCGGDPEAPFYRSSEALVAATAAHLCAARIAPEARILSLIGAQDLLGLATGLAAALVSGASLETLPVFDGQGFARALARPVPTHLVVPAFLERNLAGRDLPESLRSVILARRAPAPLGPAIRAGEALRVSSVVDALAFGETALLSRPRGEAGDLGLVLARPDRLALPANLMAMRREGDGRIGFRGRACNAAPLQRGSANPASDENWRATPYALSASEGVVAAVETARNATPDASAAA